MWSHILMNLSAMRTYISAQSMSYGDQVFASLKRNIPWPSQKPNDLVQWSFAAFSEPFTHPTALSHDWTCNQSPNPMETSTGKYRINTPSWSERHGPAFFAQMQFEQAPPKKPRVRLSGDRMGVTTHIWKALPLAQTEQRFLSSNSLPHFWKSIATAW